MTVTVERESAPEETDTRHQMRIADHTGDTEIKWSVDNEVEVAIARASFDKAKDKGYLAYRAGTGGRDNELMRSFDPEAERIVLMPQTVGG